MKKTLLCMVAFLLTGVIACSSVNKNVATYPEITMQKFNDTCESPDEVHAVPAFRFPIPAQVIRHKKCMEVEDLLVVVWPGELNEKNLTAVKLLALMYVEHQGNEHSVRLLKTDRRTMDGGLVVNMAFYELKKTVKENNE